MTTPIVDEVAAAIKMAQAPACPGCEGTALHHMEGCTEIGFPVAGTVEAEEQRFLHRPYFPLVPTVVAGIGGLGKSHVAIDLTARVTRGAAGGDVVEPSGVFFLSAEDAAATVLRPRLEAAGAKLDNVRLLGPDGGWTLSNGQTDDLDRLASVIDRWDVPTRLVVVDPWSAFLPTGIDANKDADVRSLLRPLAVFCESLGLAVVLIAHLNKSQSSSFAIRVGGSGGLYNAARSALLVAEHPEGDGRRVLVHAKSNAAALGEGRSFAIESATVDGRVHTSRLVWGEVVQFSASELLEVERHNRFESRDAAATFLREILADGPLKSTWIREAAEKQGLTWRTVRRAQHELDIRPYREGFGKEGVWMWTLG